MNILPQNTKEFLNKKYWDKFFGKLKEQGGKDEFFEWYGNYKDFDYILQKILKPNEKMLNIGCGKSLFSEDMYDEGFTNILNIDYSEQVIEDMKNRSQKLRPKLQYEVMDIFNMSYKDDQFENILDKGCLDAVYPDDKPETKEQVLKLFNEIIRVSTKRYVAVSLLQDHIIETILSFFVQLKGYQVSIYEVLIKGSKLYPFLIDIQFKESENNKIALHLKKNENQPIYVDVEECKKEIKNIQLQNHFMGSIKKLRTGQRYTIDLWDAENKTTPKYTLNIVDSQSKSSLESKTCGCFIVPQGKENGYLFSTEKGNFDLLEQTRMSRLIVAILNPGFIFDDLKKVQKELSPALQDVIPKGCSNTPVPFMTDADELGEKGIIVQDDNLVVEEIIIDEEVFRRLILKSNYNQVQSQFKLTYVASNNPQKQYLKEQEHYQLMSKKKNMFIGIDESYLDFDAHRAMVAGLSLFSSQDFNVNEFKVLILGGGLCGLGKFLATHFAHLNITNVEISQSIIDVVQADAISYIEKKVKNQEKNKKKKIAQKKKKNSTDEQSQEQQENQQSNDENKQKEQEEQQQGEEEIQEEQQNQIGNEFGQDYIIIDINGGIGKVSPPEQFLTTEFLQKLQKQLKPNTGVLSINVLAFNDIQKQEVIAKLSSVFDIIYSLDTESDLNEVFYCVNHNFKRQVQSNQEEIILVEPQYIPDRKQQEKNFKNHLKTRSKYWDQTLNIEEQLGQVKMIIPKIHGNTYERNNYHVIGQNEGETFNKTKQQYMKDLSCINKSQQKKKQKRSKK
ncbi:hypothetical protein PPERSA_04305 [Pseudocohnilembus persalinus]|uniref:Cyclic nucleotide-binding domain-containing protein n=1 Tax=Pseudocohnilembus persalinus TaxID=266149 RepID=A0A0V0QP77_PSEPJ|nr:hypothetical protein PPERSA_04305 [Pseudocohnilembus persalinus]|eukprot:KRX03797.1 hypothetical protein PPERSA_04305 [Pseudocohnilembus persalinus]